MTARAALLLCLATACVSEHNLGDTPKPLGTPRWAVSFGGTSGDFATQIAIDPAGDLFAAGTFSDTVDFGSGPVDSSTAGTWWFQKRNGATGAAMWTRMLGVSALAIDDAGNVLVTGGSGADSPVPGQAWLAKYSTNGTLQWAQGFGPHSGGGPSTMAVTPDGTIYVAGTFSGRIELPGVVLGGTTNPARPFIAAFGSDGTLRWIRTPEAVGTLVTASDGSVLMSSSTDKQFSLGGFLVRPNSASSGWIAQLTTNGDVAWAHAFGPLDKMLMVGTIAATDSGIALSSQYGTPPGFPNATGVTTLDSAGMVEWSTSSDATSGRAIGSDIAVAAGGAIVTTGSLMDYNADLGGGPLTGTSYLAAFDRSGNYLEGRAFGDHATDSVIDLKRVVASPNGTIAAAGHCYAPLDVGTGAVSCPDRTYGDVLLMMFDPPAP